MEAQKKKHTTSTAVKARYNKKTYLEVRAMLPISLVASFKEKCVERGVSQAEIIRKGIEAFLDD